MPLYVALLYPYAECVVCIQKHKRVVDRFFSCSPVHPNHVIIAEFSGDMGTPFKNMKNLLFVITNYLFLKVCDVVAVFKIKHKSLYGKNVLFVR